MDTLSLFKDSVTTQDLIMFALLFFLCSLLIFNVGMPRKHMESKLHIITPNNKSKFFVLIQILKQRNVDPETNLKSTKVLSSIRLFYVYSNYVVTKN